MIRELHFFRRELTAVAIISAVFVGGLSYATAGEIVTLRVQELPTPLVGTPPTPDASSYYVSRPAYGVAPSARIRELAAPAPANNCGPSKFEVLSGADKGRCVGY